MSGKGPPHQIGRDLTGMGPDRERLSLSALSPADLRAPDLFLSISINSTRTQLSGQIAMFLLGRVKCWINRPQGTLKSGECRCSLRTYDTVDACFTGRCSCPSSEKQTQHCRL